MSQDSVSQDLWPSVKKEFQALFPADVFHTWFEPVEQVTDTDGRMKLSVPNDFSAIWIKDNYLDLIRQKAEQISGRGVRVAVEVRTGVGTVRGGDVGNDRKTSRNAGNGRGKSADPVAPAPRTPESATPDRTRLGLNPRNTFDNFIVGSSNQLAHAASLAVGKSPAKAYNPLFLYGDTGLGKTHLMHAIAHHTLETSPKSRVVYVSCEKFTNEFIHAIQEHSVIAFRKYYRSIDVLLIDDIHFLAGKERIQEEFFHTFNELFESQHQICISSDRPASEIAKLESRLVSRFQWGMVTDIQAPDLETRVAILAKKAQALGHVVAPEILQFLAERITRNVRRMEGALTRVASYTTLTSKALDVPTAERLLQDILQEEAQRRISVEKIQQAVVAAYNLHLADMVSKRRPNNIAFPRQIAMYLSRVLTAHSLQEIGDAFGGRDHGTVIHACKTVENMMEQDDSVRQRVNQLTNQLRG